ncbi:MAG: magnesium chelatase ATPase subunit I [Pseudomonadota bacterium]
MPAFPFSAIVGQDDLKTALLLTAIDPTIGGVLAMGDRGTGKTTAIRALAGLLPVQSVVKGCPFRSDPADPAPDYPGRDGKIYKTPKIVEEMTPVVTLPLGATEDRVLGALDLEQALVNGEMRFEAGLLAKAHRGYLYVDEVNLLDDYLVDVLLDVAASGVNTVEREGLSLVHPARFVLVGSGNPEEGDLRPQLLDRFGLSVEVQTPEAIEDRVEIIKRRDAFDLDPDGMVKTWRAEDAELREMITRAQHRLKDTKRPDAIVEMAARICLAVGSDGLRGELTLIRAARALAALHGESEISAAHLKTVAPFVLGHRLRKDPLDETGAAIRIQRALETVS